MDTTTPISQDAFGANLKQVNPTLTPEQISSSYSAFYPKPSASIDATQIQNVKPFAVPQPATPTDLNGMIASYSAEANKAQTLDTKAENTYDSSQNDLVSLTRQLEGQTPDTVALEESQGIPQLNKELLDLQSLQSQQLAGYLSSYNNLEKSKTSIEGINTGQAEMTRQHGIDALVTSSLLQAKQGNITTAQATVDRAIAAKYDPLKARIETSKLILSQNYDLLSRADKKLADAKNTELNLQLKKIDQQQEQDKAKQSIIIDAAQQGAPNSILLKAQQAGTPEEAAQILGKYSSAYLDRQMKQAQISNVYSQIAERNQAMSETERKSNFVTPPLVNPQTGAIDPVSQLTSVIDGAGAKDNANLQNVLGVVSAVQQLAGNNSDGSFKGLSPLPRLTPGFAKSQEQISNKGAVEAINLKVQQWASGASLTDKQTKQVEGFTPNKGDSDNAVRNKINSLTNFMLSQAQSALASQGIKYTPQTVDYFNSGITKLSDDQLLATIPASQTALENNQSFFDK